MTSVEEPSHTAYNENNINNINIKKAQSLLNPGPMIMVNRATKYTIMTHNSCWGHDLWGKLNSISGPDKILKLSRHHQAFWSVAH